MLKMMVGSNLTDQQLQQVVDKTIMYADTDHDGKISFDEFCAVRRLRGPSRRAARDASATVAATGRGLIRCADARRRRRWSGTRTCTRRCSFHCRGGEGHAASCVRLACRRGHVQREGCKLLAGALVKLVLELYPVQPKRVKEGR